MTNRVWLNNIGNITGPNEKSLHKCHKCYINMTYCYDIIIVYKRLNGAQKERRPILIVVGSVLFY